MRGLVNCVCGVLGVVLVLVHGDLRGGLGHVDVEVEEDLGGGTDKVVSLDCDS